MSTPERGSEVAVDAVGEVIEETRGPVERTRRPPGRTTRGRRRSNDGPEPTCAHDDPEGHPAVEDEEARLNEVGLSSIAEMRLDALMPARRRMPIENPTNASSEQRLRETWERR